MTLLLIETYCIVKDCIWLDGTQDHARKDVLGKLGRSRGWCYLLTGDMTEETIVLILSTIILYENESNFLLTAKNNYCAFLHSQKNLKKQL